MKKQLTLLLTALVLGLTGCSKSENNNNSGGNNSGGNNSGENNNQGNKNTGGEETNNETLRMESEYVNLTGVTGSGISGSASGLNLIQKNKDASNGYYVGFTHREGFAITYEFTAKVASSVTIYLGLGNELGVGMEFGTDSLTVVLNGNKVNYKKNITVWATGYKSYEIGTADLVAGKNTLVTTVVGPNEYCNGGTGGPEFDYVELNSAGNNLSWTPLTDNIDD